MVNVVYLLMIKQKKMYLLLKTKIGKRTGKLLTPLFLIISASYLKPNNRITKCTLHHASSITRETKYTST